MKFWFSPQQKDNLRQWAEWLETTELTQGTGALKAIFLDDIILPSEVADIKNGDEVLKFLTQNYKRYTFFCCLGVYAEYKNPNRFSRRRYSAEFYLKNSTDNSTAYLPTNYKQELGFSNKRNGEGVDLEELFVSLNDGHRYTFSDIAVEIRHLVETGRFTKDTEKVLYLDEDDD
jgi:hypothetical protein